MFAARNRLFSSLMSRSRKWVGARPEMNLRITFTAACQTLAERGKRRGGGRESWKLAYRRVEILADMIAGDKGRDRLFENDPGQVETWLIVATKRGKEAADYDSSGFVVRSLRVCIHLSRHLDCSYCSRFPGR